MAVVLQGFKPQWRKEIMDNATERDTFSLDTDENIATCKYALPAAEDIETASSLACVRQCPKKYENEYIKLMQIKKEREYLTFGTNGHKALAIFFKNGPDALQDHFNSEGYQDDSQKLMSGKIRALVNQFIRSEEALSIKPIMIEEHIEYQCEDKTIAGLIDLVGEVNGKKWLIDHKFLASISDASSYKLNSQMDSYLLALSKMGIQCEGIIWNLIRKPSIKVKQKETIDEYIERLQDDVDDRPDFYYMFLPVKRTPNEIAENDPEVAMQIKYLNWLKETGNFFKDKSRCGDYGGCQFNSLCTPGLSMDEFETKDSKHLELEGGNDENSNN